MTYEFLELTNQVQTAHWAWTIGFFLWFVGMAGMGLFINVWVRSRTLFYIASGAAWIGTLLVLSHLSRLLNLPVAGWTALTKWSFNFTSWMFIGICILAILCIWTALQMYMVCRKVRGVSRCPFTESNASYWINAVLGVAATAYSGFLLTQAVGISLWNTGIIPVLWIFSGLSCALGIVEVLEAMGKLEGRNFGWLPMTSHCAHIGEAFVIFAFVSVAWTGTPGAMAGAKSLVMGENAVMFWFGAIGLGLVLPTLFAMVKKNKTVLLVGGLCAILGALFLRASVLFAGYYDPTFLG